MLLPRGCGSAALSTGGAPGHRRHPSLKASFLAFFLVAEHLIIYKILKVVVLNLLAYEPDFFFSSGSTGMCRGNLLSLNVLKRCP